MASRPKWGNLRETVQACRVAEVKVGRAARMREARTRGVLEKENMVIIGEESWLNISVEGLCLVQV